MHGMKRSWFHTFLTLVVLLTLTTGVFLYSSGFRVKKDEDQAIDLTKTGMVSAKSMPEGATVYFDDKLVTATNDTISGVEPGVHSLRIVKKGYETWSKDIEVFAELVTDITAVLVSQSPMFEPLTNTGARNPSVSPSLTKLAYFSKDEATPGVWIIPINQGGLNLFRANPSVVLEDTRVIKYSDGKSIMWSPDEDKLLVQTNDDFYYLVNLTTNTSQSLTNEEEIITEWQQKLQKKREDFVSKLDIPDDIKALALSPNVMWSPDEKKFLYKVNDGTNITHKVYNMEKPLPVGEKIETVVFATLVKDPQPEVTWYSDSFHLILTEGNVTEEKRGTVSLIRIDGTNKIEIYGEAIHSPKVYSVPAGDKIIILTSFKSGDQTDLYTVGIR